jgi:tetratricopeptide (TPR) repeat protein
MRSARTCVALAAIIAFCSFPRQARPQPQQLEIDSADRLFQSGKFVEAGKLYLQIVAQNPKDHSATLQLGRIALLSNQLDDAQKWLEKAKALQPDDADAKVMLAQVFYRNDDFQKAAASLNGIDVSSNKLIISQYPTMNVAKLESFKGQTPYEVQGNGTSTRVKFVKTDPLPVLNARVNGGEEVTFFIDTGGSEVALDTDFAKELGVPHLRAPQPRTLHFEVPMKADEGSSLARNIDRSAKAVQRSTCRVFTGKVSRQISRIDEFRKFFRRTEAPQSVQGRRSLSNRGVARGAGGFDRISGI